MLVYGVEGNRSAASLVKDSKTYIEIAKFVEAYTTIIQNPNEFLAEVGEQPINPETDILSWAQLVKILTTCDLGFDPVPNEKQLISYYAYARQIGSISKEVKQLATVSDVAEAQKHYYNFVDEETEKVTTMYNKQHEIAEHRAKEVQVIDNNLKKKQSKNAMFFFGMMVGVLFIMLGACSAAFDLLGLGGYARFIIGGLFIVIGIACFYIFDKLYIKGKRDYYGYHKSTREAVSRSEKTSLDEKVLRDKLAKYEKDLKIAKFELADKEKRFDVEKNIAILKEKNKYYRMLRNRENGRDFEGFGRRRRMSLINELEQSNSESLFSIFGGDDTKRMRKKSGGIFEEISDLFRVGSSNGIDEKNRATVGTLSSLTGMPEMPNGFKNYLKPYGLNGNNQFRLKHDILNSKLGERTFNTGYLTELTAHGNKKPINYFTSLLNMQNENKMANNATQINRYNQAAERFLNMFKETNPGLYKDLKVNMTVNEVRKNIEKTGNITSNIISQSSTNDLKSSLITSNYKTIDLSNSKPGKQNNGNDLTTKTEQNNVNKMMNDKLQKENLDKKLKEFIDYNQRQY